MQNRTLVPSSVAVLDMAQVAEVVENLPAHVTRIRGAITGHGLEVEMDDLAVFASLAASSGLVYVDAQTWADCDAADMVVRVPSGREADAAVVKAAVVLGGVVHTLLGADHRLVRQVEARQDRDDQEQEAWVAQRAADEARVTEVAELVEDTYPARMLASEDWLLVADQRGRERLPRAWAADEFPDVAGVPRVRGAVLTAVGEASDRREREVIPARLAAFETDLPEHAGRLATVPGWDLATTTAARVAHARRYIAAADSLVPPAVLVDRLIALAL